MTKSRLFTTSELLSVALKPRRSNFLSNKIVLSQTMSFSYKPKDTTVQFSHSSTFYSLREQVVSKKKKKKKKRRVVTSKSSLFKTEFKLSVIFFHTQTKSENSKLLRN